MKYLLAFAVVLILGISGYAWWSAAPTINSNDKLHKDLYEGASGSWNPQMEVVAFERAPSTALTLRWQPPTESYNHFVLTISTADGTLVRKESGEHDRVSLDPDGLESDTEYVFAIQACLDRNCDSWMIAQDEYRGRTEASDLPETIEASTNGSVDTSVTVE
jgi:hypothetical protein